MKSKKSFGLIASISLIWAGAVGNILDSMFYGLMFSGSQHGVAHLTSFGGGYASFLHGRVVDMLYFPLIEGNYPSWFPIVGGKHFQFFQPIFNIADTSISVGVGMVIVFYRRFFKDLSDQPESLTATTAVLNTDTTDTEVMTTETLDATKTEGKVLDDKTIGSVEETGMDIPMDDDLD